MSLLRYPKLWSVLAVLSYGTLSAAPLASDMTQTFSVDKASHIPGAVLDPGTYSISILDYLTDRAILQVKDSSGKVRSSFLGIRRSKAQDGARPGLNQWDDGSSLGAAYRSWVLPKSQGMLEFAYPKADAVALAKSNHAQVPAIDPESEGKPPAGSLTSDDMQVVGLWLLSSSRVGPGDGEAAIQAAKFQADPQQMATVAAPARPASVVARLPHTASSRPLIGLLGISAMAFAGALAFARKRFNA